jgi:MFS family permease
MVTFMARASLLTDLPPAFRWVLAGIFVNRVGTFVAPFLVLYLTGERGLSPALAGGALAAWGVGGLVATPLAGFGADHFGRRETLLACMLGAAGALLLLGAARAEWLILLAAFLSGGTADGFRPASQAIVADIVEPALRPRAYAMTFWATNIGFAGAALTGGALASVGWGWLFAVDAASCALFGVMIFLRLPETRPVAAEGETPGSFRTVVRDRLLWVMAALFFFQTALLFQAFSTLPLAMDADGLSPTAFGAVVAVNGVVIITLQPLVAGWLGRSRRERVLAAALALMGAGFASTGLAHDPATFAASVVVWTFGEIGFAAVAFATVADLAPPNVRGRYSSLAIGAGGVAFALAPLGGTALFETAGENAVWVACAAVGALGAATALAAGPALNARLTRESPRPA